MDKRKALARLIVLAAGLVMVAWAALTGLDVATVRLPRENDRLLAAGVIGSDEFISLSYRHSVELTRVEGRFKIVKGPVLAAWQTRQASVGTGLPNAYPERTTIEDGWMVIDEGMKDVGRVRFFLVPINQPRLKLGKNEIELSGLKPGSLLSIGAESVSVWRFWLWRLTGRVWPYPGGYE